MNKERGLYLILCLGLLTYVVLRAIHVPLVHDEVATYIHYVHQGEFIPGDALVDANNHILNSFLSICADRLFGTSPLSLRLFNILSFFVFAFYLFRLAFRVDDKLLRWAFIVALLGSHYLIEFFALSRGYGISMAALLGLVWHLGNYLDTHRLRDGLTILFWMFIGLGANLSLLFVMLLTIGILLMDRLRTKQGSLLLILPMLLLILGSVAYTLKLKSIGALYYGQGDGFWQVTMETLSLYLGGEDHILPFILSAMALLSLLVYLIRPFSMAAFLKRNWLFHILLLGSLCGIFSAHMLFGANYPEDRVGLYLYPLLIGAVIQSLAHLKVRWPKLRFISLGLLYFPIHFLLNANLDHCDFWFRERVPEEFYTILSDEFKEKDAMVTLSGYNTTALTYFMGAQLAEQEVPPLVSFDFASDVADFVLLRGAHQQTFDMSDLELLSTDLPSGNTLWERKVKKEKILLDTSYASGIDLPNDEYHNLFKMKLPGDQNYAISFDVTYTTDEFPADINLVLSSKDDQGTDQQYIPHSLGWRQDDPTLSERGMLYFNGSGSGEDEIVFYLWNMDKVALHDLEYRASIYRLD